MRLPLLALLLAATLLACSSRYASVGETYDDYLPAGDEATCGDSDPGVQASLLWANHESCLAGAADACETFQTRLRAGCGARQDRSARFGRARNMCARGARLGCTQAANEARRARQVEEMRYHYERACLLGHRVSCQRLGQFYSNLFRDYPREPELGPGSRAYRRACHLGLGSACYDVAWFMEFRSVPGRTIVDARAYYTRACELDHSVGCANLGRMWMFGRGGPQDDNVAVWPLLRSCQGESSAGCYHLGLLYAEGRGLAQDWDAALRAYRVGCSRGSGPACLQMGIHYDQGRHVARDRAQAADFFRQSCNRRDPEACSRLSAFYLDGEVFPRDPQYAESLLSQACEQRHAWSCRAYGDFLAGDTLEEPDVLSAAVLYRRAADLGNGYAARRLAALYDGDALGPRNSRHAARLYAESCRLGDTFGCYVHATRILQEERQRGYADDTRLIPALERACNGREFRACDLLVQAHSQRTRTGADPSQVPRLLAQQCEAGHSTACAHLDRAARHTPGPVAPFVQFSSCANKDSAACYAMAIGLIQEGESAPIDARVLLLLERACALGHADACEQAVAGYQTRREAPSQPHEPAAADLLLTPFAAPASNARPQRAPILGY